MIQHCQLPAIVKLKKILNNNTKEITEKNACLEVGNFQLVSQKVKYCKIGTFCLNLT